MNDAPEFPQADPSIRYIAQQCAKIEEQYACNAGYRKDHKAIKQRLDNLDEIISTLKKTVIAIQDEKKKSGRHLDEIQDLYHHLGATIDSTHKQNFKEIQDLYHHLDAAIESANNKILRKFEGEQKIRLNELRNATQTATDTLRNFDQKAAAIYIKYEEINMRLNSEIKKEVSQIISNAWQKNMMKYIIASVGFCIVSMLAGKFIL
jgi:uncharacterized membrane-anchored protein YjiN (DUF445 family)